MASGMRKTGGMREFYPEEYRRAETLVRSLRVLDEWLEENEGRTDEAHVLRIKRWREEVLNELELRLGPDRP